MVNIFLDKIGHEYEVADSITLISFFDVTNNVFIKYLVEFYKREENMPEFKNIVSAEIEKDVFDALKEVEDIEIFEKQINGYFDIKEVWHIFDCDLSVESYFDIVKKEIIRYEATHYEFGSKRGSFDRQEKMEITKDTFDALDKFIKENFLI